ncbi:hypothetical protein DID88_002487 [Monilinia fructigena]|uniref:NmrA-like domain-containing protein n=1 Tax=Monilinia fructigena TaxID=38457 RepID=A0A395IQX2_9HELO|nr:hypothetical protein DID88_002487 [Monilinia fructigena]
MSAPQRFVAVAERNVAVKALVRPGTAASRTQRLRDAGVIITEVDMNDIPAITKSVTGATTVVSALQGLRGVILGVQGRLLEASVAAKVQRFIPSDYSLDFTKCDPGTNRNLDLRREFHAKLDASGIKWTMCLNDGTELCIFGSADQKFDYTTIPDTAAYTAAVAADSNPTPKFLRIAGSSVNAKDLAAIVTKVRGEQGEEDKVFPPWQGMQYLENMVSGKGKLDPIDNDRYPDLEWTTVEKGIIEADAEKNKSD